MEWSDNIKISDKAPKDYVPELEKRFNPEELERMYQWHGLPKNWYDLDYTSLINERKKLIALVIKSGFEMLRGGA